MDLKSSPIDGPLTGSYRPPGDKSISHRLALLCAMAKGRSVVHGFLDSHDTLATAKAMEAMGADIEWTPTEHGYSLVIQGGHLRAPEVPLDFGNSGTGIRLSAGLLAGLGEVLTPPVVDIELIGDASLSRRPMMRIIEPLKTHGADVKATDGHAPLFVRPSTLHGARHDLNIASAQVKSALLLAGLNAHGQTRIKEPTASRDHTERLFEACGVELERVSDTEVVLNGPQSVKSGIHHVPGDISSAAFMLAAGLLVPGSEVTLHHVGLNPTRDGILRIIRAMQGQLEVDRDSSKVGEPIGVIKVRASALMGIDIDPDWVPLAIDEFPMVMGMAALAQGSTTIRGAAELRVKESDRLAMMCSQLKALGVEVEERPDGATVVGGQLQGGTVECAGDHRIAMTFAVLGLVAQSPIVIKDAHWMQTSYPSFVDDLNRLGGRLEWLG